MTEMQILVCGWSVAAVTDRSPWSYSIGVLENFNHPELVVMDMKIEAARGLINYVGSKVRDGSGTLDHDALAAQGIRLGAVHERHMGTDLFNSWKNYYGEDPWAGDFLQILPPRSMFCACHEASYQRLDRAA